MPADIDIDIVYLETDILIVGGGAAGCMAAITAKDTAPGCQVLIMEKAQLERSGCLAAGINAINAYLNPGETPESFLDYVKKEACGIIQDELVLSMAKELNEMTRVLEHWGLPIYKDEDGNYLARGKRSIRIKGERIKPIIAAQVKKRGIPVLNRVAATNYLIQGGRVMGAMGFSVREKKFYVIRAKATICATAGAAGIYGPNNPGWGRHRIWYPPFNTGAGLAMGLRAGAEMTSFEMRFIALRVKDTLAPTGTVAQGVKVSQVNGLGQNYLQQYRGLTTAGRLKAGLVEEEAGRGPCYLDTTKLSNEEAHRLKEAYLHMCPVMVLSWANQEVEPNQVPLEIAGSEPYLVGGHAMAGYWIDEKRHTTVPGLYAVGEVAGGVPKKYVTGSMAEGKIAALAALEELNKVSGLDPMAVSEQEDFTNDFAIIIQREFNRTFKPLIQGEKQEPGIQAEELEEALQKVMDEYAGGIKDNYKLTEAKLKVAAGKLIELERLMDRLVARDLHELMACHEVIDRMLIARALVEHLRYRKESRWSVYQERLDYPQREEAWEIFVNSTYDPAGGAINILSRNVKGELANGSADHQRQV
jgi:adenylylsulfate reductase subunit A